MDTQLKDFQNLPTEAKIDQILGYIAQSDKQHAQAKRRLEELKKAESVVKASVYIDRKKAYTRNSKEKITENYLDQLVHASEEYQRWVSQYGEALAEYTLINNERERAFTVIEVWRSLVSAKGKGVLV